MKILAFILFSLNMAFAFDLDFTSLQADFTQTIKSQDSSISYKGHFALSENRALWEYYDPSLKRIFLSSNKVIIVDDELEQAIISSTNSLPNLKSILSNAKKINNGLYKAEFDGVEYFIGLDKDGLIKNIDYKDKLENKVKITLENVTKDKSIDPAIFTPTIPSQYDIINQ